MITLGKSRSGVEKAAVLSRTVWRMFLGAAALVVATVFAQQQTQAAVITSGCANTNVSCSLGELIGGGTIQVDDKLFTNWQQTLSLTVNNVGGFLSANRIAVSGAGEGTSAPGLTYTNLGQVNVGLLIKGWGLYEGVAGGTLVPPSSLAHQFAFDVVVQGTDLIEDNTLDMVLDTFVDPGFGASATVGEVVSDITDTTVLGTKTVTDALLSDSAMFSPQPSVHVVTTINLATTNIVAPGISLNGGPIVKIDTLTQRFSQIAGPTGGMDIPEPATLALFAIGLIGLGTMRRRRVF